MAGTFVRSSFRKVRSSVRQRSDSTRVTPDPSRLMEYLTHADVANLTKLHRKKRIDLSVGLRWERGGAETVHAIHVAAAVGTVETVRFLFNIGAAPDMTTGSGLTPLHFAAMHNFMNPAVVEQLVSSGAKVGARDKLRRTALHYACEHRNREAAKLLLSYQNLEKLADYTDLFGSTAKDLATEKNFPEIVALFDEAKGRENLRRVLNELPGRVSQLEEKTEVIIKALNRRARKYAYQQTPLSTEGINEYCEYNTSAGRDRPDFHRQRSQSTPCISNTAVICDRQRFASAPMSKINIQDEYTLPNRRAYNSFMYPVPVIQVGCYCNNCSSSSEQCPARTHSMVTGETAYLIRPPDRNAEFTPSLMNKYENHVISRDKGSHTELRSNINTQVTTHAFKKQIGSCEQLSTGQYNSINYTLDTQLSCKSMNDISKLSTSLPQHSGQQHEQITEGLTLVTAQKNMMQYNHTLSTKDEQYNHTHSTKDEQYNHTRSTNDDCALTAAHSNTLSYNHKQINIHQHDHMLPCYKPENYSITAEQKQRIIQNYMLICTNMKPEMVVMILFSKEHLDLATKQFISGLQSDTKKNDYILSEFVLKGSAKLHRDFIDALTETNQRHIGMNIDC